MQFLTRKGFYLQRVLLELKLKEVLVKLYQGYYISNYDELIMSEAMINLKDIRIIDKMINVRGDFFYNKEILSENKDDEFCELLLNYLEIQENIAEYDKTFNTTFIDPRKKRLVLTENVTISVISEINELYKTSFGAVNEKGFEDVIGLGLIGSYVVCKRLEDFNGCPLWQNELGYLVPLRNLKDKTRVKYKPLKTIELVEVNSFNLNGVLNSMMVQKSKGLVKGYLQESIPVNEIWEVCKE